MNIREALNATDLDAARSIFREYIASISHVAACSFEHQRADDEIRDLPGKYAPPSGAIFLAFDGPVCVGCAALRPLPSGATDQCELKRMYVRPTHRAQGLGGALCEAVMARASAAGYRRIFLDSDPELEAALRLYRRLGFVDTPRFNDDPDPRTIYMARAVEGLAGM
ncbi:MAG: GNAT family N-acetyltransferase [Phycisphaerales bacterium]